MLLEIVLENSRLSRYYIAESALLPKGEMKANGTPAHCPFVAAVMMPCVLLIGEAVLATNLTRVIAIGFHFFLR